MSAPPPHPPLSVIRCKTAPCSCHYRPEGRGSPCPPPARRLAGRPQRRPRQRRRPRPRPRRRSRGSPCRCGGKNNGAEVAVSTPAAASALAVTQNAVACSQYGNHTAFPSSCPPPIPVRRVHATALGREGGHVHRRHDGHALGRAAVGVAEPAGRQRKTHNSRVSLPPGSSAGGGVRVDSPNPLATHRGHCSHLQSQAKRACSRTPLGYPRTCPRRPEARGSASGGPCPPESPRATPGRSPGRCRR